MCTCGEVIQYAAHIVMRSLVEREVRTAEDLDFCRAVYTFLKGGNNG